MPFCLVKSHTVGPEEQLIRMGCIVSRPEPVTKYTEYDVLGIETRTYQKKSFRVSFFAPEIGMRPAQDGPASKLTVQVHRKFSLNAFSKT